MQFGGFYATNFSDLSKGVTAPQKDRELLRDYLQRRPAVKRREGPGGFFDNHREVSDQAEIDGSSTGLSLVSTNAGSLRSFICVGLLTPCPWPGSHNGIADRQCTQWAQRSRLRCRTCCRPRAMLAREFPYSGK